MDTPFKQHLGTNYIPSTEEIDQINAYISIKEKQLAETQRSLEEITRKRDSLRESVESHRALASPARRLPSDIIQEIFLRCLPSKSDAIISSKEAPTKLTQICSAWRDIAVSLPPLWSSIQISFVKLTDPSDSVPEMTYRHYEAVQLWLQRSGSADVINLFARQLLSVSNRWKNIYLDVTDHILEKLEEVSPDNLCNLETLQIHPHYYDLEQNKADISTVSKTRALWLLSQTTNLVKFNFLLDGSEDCNLEERSKMLTLFFYFSPLLDVLSHLWRAWIFLVYA
ncbi:hypothetical protein BDQ12DRAFT_713533 [Crucibulum laeve]|uniref:Uncharacterized protein n=1 Tax=Crucibulum laeve TaxID=68775 RepID=A0A5C3LYI3_9AGAR|nr:hypothetical protein BDQ12DRAFT_713533 [Crucibulum laeve]